jgi:catechol 2,3-dioxygenase-like lactoylglutathione lyase family enzyme
MTPNFILAYVADAATSAELYGKLLGLEPTENRDGFAMFVLPNGVNLGLWAKDTVEPAPTAPGGMEIGFPVPDDAAVETTAKAWRQLGLAIAQAPTRMDFGLTFTAVDPDGHRLRVFAPSATATTSRKQVEAATA